MIRLADGTPTMRIIINEQLIDAWRSVFDMGGFTKEISEKAFREFLGYGAVKARTAG